MRLSHPVVDRQGDGTTVVLGLFGYPRFEACLADPEREASEPTIGDEVDGVSFFLGVYHWDLTPELELIRVDTVTCAMSELEEGRATRVTFDDEDQDGHDDLVLETV